MRIPLNFIKLNFRLHGLIHVYGFFYLSEKRSVFIQARSSSSEVRRVVVFFGQPSVLLPIILFPAGCGSFWWSPRFVMLQLFGMWRDPGVASCFASHLACRF